MESGLQALVELWEVDREMRSLRRELSSYPAEEKRRLERLGQLKQGAERIRERIRELQVRLKEIETDVSDKPSWIRQQSKLSSSQISAINKRHENRVESLQAVDDLVAGVVNALDTTKTPSGAKALANTYIFFTSDNGFHHGEHRIAKQKWRPYEEDIHMPLLVRGPGIAAGSTTDKLTLNTDYMPTFLDLAGSQIPAYADGRPLRPVLNGSVTTWRSAILPEAAANYSPAYEGIRTISTVGVPARKYLEYSGGVKELYNLDTDPSELTNVYNPTAPPADLVSRLQALKGCAGNGCFTAENGP